MGPVQPISVTIAGKPRRLVRSLATVIYLRELAETEPAIYQASMGAEAKGGDPQAAYMRAYPHLIHALLTREDRDELTPEYLLYEIPLEEALAAGQAVMGLLSEGSATDEQQEPDPTKKKTARRS